MWPKCSKQQQNQWFLMLCVRPLLGFLLKCFGSPNGGHTLQKEVLKSLPKLCRKTHICLIDFGVPLGSKMEPNIDQKSIIFQVGAPEGPRGRCWKDFGPILELFWDDFRKMFGRISMLGLIVFNVFLLTFRERFVWDIVVCYPVFCHVFL